MKKLEIFSQHEFDAALASGSFKTATDVRLDNLPGITAVPELPAATDVWLDNLPGITAKPRIHKRGSLYRNGRI